MKQLSKTETSKIFQNLSEGIIIHSPDTSIEYFNSSALKILNLKADELLNKDANDPKWFFIDQENNKLSYEQYPVVTILQTKKPLQNYIMGIKKLTNGVTWVNLNGVPIFNKGKLESVVISFVDITKQVKALNIAYQKSYYHRLTNLPNSSMLEKTLNESNKQEVHVLVLLQIENYSNLMQYYGSELCYEILEFIVSVLKQQFITAKHMLFHTELDKFAVTLDNSWDIVKIDTILQKLNEEELFFEKLGLSIQVVAGISFENSDHYLTAQAALTKSIKDQERYEVYSQRNNLGYEINNEIYWAEALRRILNLDNVKPIFQPIVNNKTLEIEKYEVLMRLELDGEIYSPAVFLSIAKKVKLYKHLTHSLIEKVFEYFNDKTIPFSINLNTEDLMCENLNNKLLEKVQNFHTPSNMTIEIVESEGIDNFKEVNRFLNRLKVYGCKIAIDDFGSGYSNFEYILKLDADYIKLDGSLIKDIDSNKDSFDIVKTIVSFAKLKGLPTIAEYVSNQKIYEIVKAIGIDYSQGFYFGKPKFEVLDVNTILKEDQTKKENKHSKYKQVIYTSEVNSRLDTQTLKEMFKGAAINNLQNDISGFIIFDKRYFLQIIEGDTQTVNKLYNVIAKDQRHKNISLLGVKEVNQRDFRDWNLGYIDEDKVIDDYLFKKTKKDKFIPHQFEYEFALDFLKGIRRIV